MQKIIDRCVGIVDSVSAYEIKGYLLDSAPQSVSMLAGSMTLFPRINGFLVIPNETGFLVGMVTWIGFNHIKSDNDVNLPKGTRLISLSILGHLVKELSGMSFERGAFSMPTVGDSILLPTEEELATIIKNDQEGCINLGISPLLGNQMVKVSVNELFGRHVAVLGNTGSGKSCTVAGLIRWSVEKCIEKNKKSPNARFIILDPNGEYASAFEGLDVEVKRFNVAAEEAIEKQLRVPAWMWTSSEWASVFQASDRTQKPILREALRDMRSMKSTDYKTADAENRIRIHIFQFEKFIRGALSTQSYLSNAEKTKFGKETKARIDSLRSDISLIEGDCDWLSVANSFCGMVDASLTSLHGEFNGNEYYNIFSVEDVELWLENLLKIESLIGLPSESFMIGEDEPIEFEVNNLPAYIETLANGTAAGQYVDFMTARIRNVLNNNTLAAVIGNEPSISLLDWINEYLGTDEAGKICIIDLSLLPSEIIHLIVGTIARLLFEALQRYRKKYGKELPTLLVMEEAHSFIHRYTDTDENNADKLCTQIFEKIAREGRKYGLGLMVSSQRPAELSQTVLSQCNSFILHRIVNDRDQDMVKRMVPDNMGSLLNELPQLPTKKAIVLGSVVPVPTIVEITDLPQNKRPKSDTPNFWGVWSGIESRENDWEPIVNAWQHVYNSEDETEN